MSVVPSKKVIQDSFQGASTRRAYSTYQRQFEAYCVEKKDGLSPVTATANDCTDFFHHLYSLGRKARTVDAAKTALVSYFNQHKVQPNPAQDILAKRYVIGLQKYNRLNNIDDEKKAHPLTVHEFSMIMNLFAEHNPFVASMVQFLLSSCFLGCFRISEVLALKWTDVAMGVDEHGKYISIRLRWHKKASVEKECQIYHLIDESLYPCLRICALYDGYLDRIRSTHMNVSKDSYVFPSYTLLQCGAVKLDWFKPLDQNILRRFVQGLVESPLPCRLEFHFTA
ncbi:hypothetical protein LEN26_002775 [Aphanomyces euteiches]|nr:hypothetical protein AeMF1_021034 [Aphanomyces euteiches]KAH9158688.1 hypothetical protein LEN26_002775 [Aphanomyces euteiches]KAH9184740.1 hypothetical protein AeNC1_013288 [Aphanomyces euteiches]